MPHDIDIDACEPSRVLDAGHTVRTSLAAPVEDPDADDLDALASSTAAVDSWDETDAQDSHLDLVALASSTSSAPPRDGADAEDARFDLAALGREATSSSSAQRRAPLQVDGVGKWRLLGLVAGLGIGFGLAPLVFGASAEVAQAARSSAPLATLRVEASAPPTAPPLISASGRVLETAVSGSVFAASERAPAALDGRTTGASVSPPRHEVSTSSRRLPAARRAPLAPAPTVPRAPEPAVVEPGPDPTPAVAASAVASSERDVDTLLEEATFPMAERRGSARPAETAHPEVLPLMPSRAQVEEVLAALRLVMRGCAMGQSGLATADIVVRSDGTVAGVRVAGAPFAGTASGRCMEGVVRPARFPRFTRPTFHVRFPFAIP